MFSFFINKIHHYYLQQALQQLRVSHATVTLASVKSVLILYDASNEEQTALVKKNMQLWQSRGVRVDVLGYISKVKKNTSLPLNYISSKQVNWLQIPSENIIDEYANKPFDLLLNFFTKNLLPLEYIAAVSKATCRIGMYKPDKAYCADFMISLKNENDLEELIQQTEHYLTQIHKK